MEMKASVLSFCICMFLLYLQYVVGDSTDEFNLSYKCQSGHVIVVAERGSNFIKMLCSPLKVCGKTRTCTSSGQSTACPTSKGHYCCGAAEGPKNTKATTSDCCQYNEVVDEHVTDECSIIELFDQWDLNDPNFPQEILTNSSKPLLPSKFRPNGLTGPDGSPNPNLKGGAGGPPSMGGGNGKGEMKKIDPKAFLPDPRNKLELKYYKSDHPANSDEIVKSIQKISNGYIVVYCKIKCKATTTTSTTTRTKTPKTPPKFLPNLNDEHKKILKGSTTPPNCGTNGQAFLDALAAASSGSSGTANQPGSQDPSTLCLTGNNTACIMACMTILQRKYLSGSCVGKDCVCKQTNDTDNFENRLIQQGLIQPNPACTTTTSKPSKKQRDPMQLPLGPPKGKKTEMGSKSKSDHSCSIDSDKVLKDLKDGSKEHSNSKQLPGYKTGGKFCDKSKDTGCMKECLRVLQRKYLEAYCIASNSTCICRQTNDTSKFEQILVQQGVVTPPKTCCKQVSPESSDLIKKLMKQSDEQEEPVKPFSKPANLCKGAIDAGCFQECLGILKKRFKSGTCDPSTNDCLCHQDSDPSNFEKNLKSCGVNPVNPRCEKKAGGLGAGGGGAMPFVPFAGAMPGELGALVVSAPLGGLPKPKGPHSSSSGSPHSSSSGPPHSSSSGPSHPSHPTSPTHPSKTTTATKKTTKPSTKEPSTSATSKTTRKPTTQSTTKSTTQSTAKPTTQSTTKPTTQSTKAKESSKASTIKAYTVPIVPIIPIVIPSTTTTKPTTKGGSLVILP